MRRGHIGVSVDPVAFGVRDGVGVGVTNSCTRHISFRRNSTKLAGIYHWERNLIFKVTTGLLYVKFSLKLRFLTSHCHDCHQTCKDLPYRPGILFNILIRQLYFNWNKTGIGGGRVVRWCWVTFQCRGVLQI